MTPLAVAPPRVRDVPLPCSKKKASKLGELLAAPEDPTQESLDLLEAILACYDDALAVALPKLASCCPGLEPHGRVKTLGTLVDKLRRTPEVKLPYIRDIAGARIVLDEGGRHAQRTVTKRVIEAFTAPDASPPKLIDRLADPRFGYHALHVEVEVLGLPVEIQLRTRLQHQWAEITESLGDKWGRGIRYGEQPELPDEEHWPGVNRSAVWSFVLRLSKTIATLEVDQEYSDRFGEREFQPYNDPLLQVLDDLDKDVKLLRSWITTIGRRNASRHSMRKGGENH